MARFFSTPSPGYTGDPEPRDLTIRHPPAVHAYADRGWTAGAAHGPKMSSEHCPI